ncbi:hypothetical protein PENTCL1PPCAC_11808, partial [Pristionchus entomophagus]
VLLSSFTPLPLSTIGSVSIMVSSPLLFSLLLAVVSSAGIPVSTTEMTIYRNLSSFYSNSSLTGSLCTAPSNQSMPVPSSLFVSARPTESMKPSSIRVASLPNVAAINQIRPRAVVDMIENAYLFLACLVMFALINVLAIDYAYGGPLFVDDSYPEETMFSSGPIQFLRPMPLSVAAPTIAPANPIHSTKWATVNKPSPKSVIPKLIASAKAKSVSRKDGSDTEC